MRALSVFVPMVFILCVASGAEAQRCGGTERWAVKVGSDPAAKQINPQAPTSTSIFNLVRLKTPQLPHDDDTRTEQEMAVRVVNGRLRKFKPEIAKNGDNDFHLVVTDDTLQFSQGKAISDHSFVAEIVDPDCVAGQQNPLSTVSVFQSQIEDVWKKFGQKFPDPKHGWNEGNGLRVRITGIGFFDRPHGQTGRARNMIEIHPVLDIEFLDDAPGPALTTSGATAAVTLIVNPGFESGGTGWTASGTDVISTNDVEPARTGTTKAWLGGIGEAHTDRLWQRVTLPASAAAITLGFYLHVSTEETSGDAFDTMAVRVLSTSGQVLRTLKTFSNLQERDDYRLETLNLTDFRGQTVRIEFLAKEDNGSLTSFVLDDISLIVQ